MLTNKVWCLRIMPDGVERAWNEDPEVHVSLHATLWLALDAVDHYVRECWALLFSDPIPNNMSTAREDYFQYSYDNYEIEELVVHEQPKRHVHF